MLTKVTVLVSDLLNVKQVMIYRGTICASRYSQAHACMFKESKPCALKSSKSVLQSRFRNTSKRGVIDILCIGNDRCNQLTKNLEFFPMKTP